MLLEIDSMLRKCIKNLIIFGHSAVLDVPRLSQAYLCPYCVILRSFLQKNTKFDNFAKLSRATQSPNWYGSGS